MSARPGPAVGTSADIRPLGGDEEVTAAAAIVAEAHRRLLTTAPFLPARSTEDYVGKRLMSVDCETHNLEAFGFWTRLFTPVAWGFERRV